jgi:hypothetical protein
VKARLAIALVLGAALLAVPAALGSNSQSFPDSIGENAQAPDITSVDVSNDDSANLTFKINISNRPALTEDMTILIFMNTDQNASTGDPQSAGSDYVIELDPGTVNLFQWDASANNFLGAQSQASLIYNYDATGATIRINASDIGGAKAVSFAVIAVSGITIDAQGNPDFTNSQEDQAPDAGHGMFTYKLLVKVSLSKAAFTTTPAKAGKLFAASLSATESDTGGPVTSGTVSCKGIVGGVKLRATHSLRHGVATCNWKLPKTSKGKLFHGTIAIASQGATLTKTFTAKIR